MSSNGAHGWQQFIRNQTTLDTNGLTITPTIGGECGSGDYNIDEMIGRVTSLSMTIPTTTPTTIDVAVYGAVTPFSDSRPQLGGDAGYLGIYIPGRTRLPQPVLVEPRVTQLDPGHPEILEDKFKRPTNEQWSKPQAIGEMPDAVSREFTWDLGGRITDIHDYKYANLNTKIGYSCTGNVLWLAQGVAAGAPAPYASTRAIGFSGPTNLWSEAWGQPVADEADETDNGKLDRSGNWGKHWYNATGGTDDDYEDSTDVPTNGNIPSDKALLELQKEWKREVAVTQAPDGTIRVHWGDDMHSVGSPTKYKMLVHTHPSRDGRPTKADIATLKERGQTESYILTTDGKRHRYTIYDTPCDAD